MKIINLELTNFKGVRSLTLALAGHDARILGENATGKTTVMDAFIWLLTGKDHQGRGELKFNIKTLDDCGEVIPMLDHSVRAVLDHDGVTFELVRTFKEVWQKKTGTNAQTFTGHKTEYSINGVPKSEKEYTAFIERIAPMQIVCLLSMTGYFNEQIEAADRRRMLLDMCGDVDDSAILARPEFVELAPHISSLVSVADLKKAQTARKTKINDEIKSIPVQINVHTQYLAEADGLNAASEQSAINALNSDIAAAEARLSARGNGEALSQLRKELAELEAAKINFNIINDQARDKATIAIRAELRRAQDEAFSAEQDVDSCDRALTDKNKSLELWEQQRMDSLAKYRELSTGEFTGDTICPTCGQPLPAEKVEAAVAQFNENKAKALEDNVTRGKSIKSTIEAGKALISAAEDALAKARSEYSEASARVTNLQAKLDAASDIPRPVFDISKIEAKEKEIADIQVTSSAATAKIAAQIADLKAQKSEHERNLSKIQNAENAAKEIKRLKASEKQLAAAYEECEKLISLCDDFTNEKVMMLDERISGAFRFARFKLTETLVNGGMREICDTLVNGVPYGAANNAARINIGLDIIETFSARYGVTLPVFVDNAESVTWLYPMDNYPDDRPQIIQLVVSAAHKNLTMEVI